MRRSPARRHSFQSRNCSPCCTPLHDGPSVLANRPTLKRIIGDPIAESTSGASYVILRRFYADPVAAQILGRCTGRVAATKWVKNDVTGLGQEPDEELRKLTWHPSGM